MTDIKHLTRLLSERTLSRVFLSSGICCNISSDTRISWNFKTFMSKYISTECIRTVCECVCTCKYMCVYVSQLTLRDSWSCSRYSAVPRVTARWSCSSSSGRNGSCLSTLSWFLWRRSPRRTRTRRKFPTSSLRYRVRNRRTSWSTVRAAVSESVLLFVSVVLKPHQTFNTLCSLNLILQYACASSYNSASNAQLNLCNCLCELRKGDIMI